MKHLLCSWKALCCAAVALLLVSCHGKSDYRNLLPADSTFTLSVNPAALVKKSGVGSCDQSPLCQRLRTELEAAPNLSDAERQYLLQLLEDPAESGVDEQKSIFLFSSMPETLNLGGQLPQQMGVLLPVADRAKFAGMVDLLCQNAGLEVQTRGKLTCVVFENYTCNGVCAFDERAALLYFAPESVETVLGKVDALFAQKARESLMGKEGVADAFSRGNDIDVIMNYAGMLKGNPILNALPVAEAFGNMTVISALNFEKGEIVCDCTLSYADAESRRQLEEFYSYVKPQKGELLRYVPKNTIAALGFGLEGKELLKVASSLPGGAMLAGNPQVQQALTSIEGDVLVDFSGMSADGRYPLMSVLAQVNDPSLLEVIQANLAGVPVEPRGENACVLTLYGTTVRFGVQDGFFYVTSDPAVMAALDGAAGESLEPKSSIFRKYSGSCYLDFAALNEMLKPMLGSSYDRESALVLNCFDELEAYGNNENGKLIVRMADREQNAFESICDCFGELLAPYLTE